jgi:hypothetical protein
MNRETREERELRISKELKIELMRRLDNVYGFTRGWDYKETIEQMRYLVRLMHNQLKWITIYYSNFKKHLTIFYKWIWCKRRDLFDIDED